MKKNNSYRYPKTQREKIDGKRHYVFDKEKLKRNYRQLRVIISENTTKEHSRPHLSIRRVQEFKLLPKQTSLDVSGERKT